MADPQTPADQLAAVNAAISAVQTGGQRVRYKDREITYADLGALLSLRKALTAEVAGTSRQRFFTVRSLG